MALLDNLASYWKLNESSGNATDSVGSNTLTNTNTVTYASGKINNGGVFVSASNQYLINSSPSGLPTGTSAFSVSFWFKQASFSANDSVFWFGTNSGGQQFGIAINSATQFNIYCNIDHLVTVSSMSTGVWHHGVVTFAGSGNGALLYVDNVASTVTANITTNIVSGYVEIGDAFGNGDVNWMFGGNIDEVGIWSRALTSGEVSSLYNNGTGLSYSFVLPITISETTNLSEGLAIGRKRSFNISETVTGTEGYVSTAPQKSWPSQAKSATTWANQNES